MTTTTTVETRPINRHLWAAALSEIGDVTPLVPRGTRDYRHPTTDVSVSLVRAVADEIEAGEPVCDHSVGICACEPAGILRELRLWLDHKRSCPACGGDGWDWEEDENVDDGGGMVMCKTCGGGGVVAAEDK